MLSIANFAGGFILLFLGVVIRSLKASGLIAGYNTASKEEKERYDEEKLTRFVGNMLIVSSVILIIGGLLPLAISMPLYLEFLSWTLFILIIVGGVIYINTGNHFKR